MFNLKKCSSLMGVVCSNATVSLAVILYTKKRKKNQPFIRSITFLNLF